MFYGLSYAENHDKQLITLLNVRRFTVFCTVSKMGKNAQITHPIINNLASFN